MLGKINLKRVAELEEVYTLAEQGFTVQEIATQKGLSIEAIKQMLLDEEELLKELRDQFNEFVF